MLLAGRSRARGRGTGPGVSGAEDWRLRPREPQEADPATARDAGGSFGLVVLRSQVLLGFVSDDPRVLLAQFDGPGNDRPQGRPGRFPWEEREVAADLFSSA